ncbi:export ABC transporter ATP-binding protein [Anaerobacillus alkalidiazotrophicus]|uniref:Export ABC transporter ATP-binding protein n=1 Tax=Anaerobacillus alkalidiazotrophicus TaxID=472963 RepID=A0A1S2M9Q0_9BACI|nr:ABC transporter ATP-binding protein [Anaerobacillus alkalidiazotrophicus]OIJ21344.1 export ABC transporter ATP-binding protein [Anaerobacillus alkalidiazotrophicus]
MVIEAVELVKSYKKVEAVKGVNLFIEKGEIVGLLGPNGAGKSTIISMISSLIKPTSGDILVKGKSVAKNPNEIRPILGVVPQDIALFLEFTAKENMYFFGRAYGLRGKKLTEKVQEILELVGLTERQNEQIKTYSGGMKRRLNIAVALLHEPEMIIMDEPTVGIDPQSRNYILETIRNLNREKKMTVLYTSHYMEEVEYLCDRLYIMDRGEIIVSGTKEEIKGILSQEQTVDIKVEEDSEMFYQSLRKYPGISSVTISNQIISIIAPKKAQLLEDIIEIAKNSGTKLLSFELQTPSLEDVFLHLTGRKLRD